jgi:hypothetical protein
MFRHQMCHPQGTGFVSSLNYISISIAAVGKINKVFVNIKIVQSDKMFLIRCSLYVGRIYSLCVDVAVVLVSGTYRLRVTITILSRWTILMF